MNKKDFFVKLRLWINAKMAASGKNNGLKIWALGWAVTMGKAQSVEGLGRSRPT